MDDRATLLPPTPPPSRPVPGPAPRTPLPLGLLLTARPRQWVKNVLVVAAPLAAGRLLQAPVLTATAIAFALFCLAASGVYLVNDARDAPLDRRHPTKRYRPVAAGVVPVRLAYAVGGLLLALAVALAAIFTTAAFASVLGVYAAVQLAYCWWLKDQPVIDLAVVSSGFLLRAVAGGAAAGIALSQWFLLVAAFGSLYMVAGKRYSELRLVSAGADAVAGGATRRSLEEYSESYLRFVWSLSAAVALMSYSLWAFDGPGATGAADVLAPWSQLSIAPFTVALLRYAVDVDRGSAGAPEDIVLGDRVLQVLGAVWLALVVLGVARV